MRLLEVRRIVSTHFIAEKFRKPTIKKHLLDGNLETIAKALTGKRLPYAYLIWKNPKFKNKPDPIQYCSCCDGDSNSMINLNRKYVTRSEQVG